MACSGRLPRIGKNLPESTVDKDLITKFARPLPRYTSYPTSPHFSDDIGPADYSEWLAALPPAADLSLYVHIPFCDTLCWFCACTTKITRRYEPVARYLQAVVAEVGHVSERVPDRCSVTHIHWGGGSPDILSVDDIGCLRRIIGDHFNVDQDAEFAVEIDPRAMDAEKISALVKAGVTRISLGVQDFDPVVQAAINRYQSVDLTRDVVAWFRAAGVQSVNIDLVYGLPQQTLSTARTTIDAVIAVNPDRVAIFGYAHLPQRITHQRLIPDETVPVANDRYALATLMSERLADAGYVRIGMDHFCKPDDSMARGPVRRNFQGYTTDTADALLGFGASAVSRLPGEFAQNATAIADYRRRMADSGLATVRGKKLSLDDRARAFAIETLMCEMRFPERELCDAFGPAGERVALEAGRMNAHVHDGLVAPSADGLVVTEKGRPFLRALAAEFDAYLERKSVVHSTGI
jgi:oxygen-independent coproporphyrinogen-3 oxidase